MKKTCFSAASIAFLAATAPLSGAAWAATTLPIEVMGTTATVTQSITIAVPAGATPDRLQMVVYNLNYEGKASVRINSTNAAHWVELKNDTPGLVFKRGGGEYGGIGGGFGTLTVNLDIPAGRVQAGTTITLEFRFHRKDDPIAGFPISSGYWIKELNLLDSNNKKLLDATAFNEPSPDTYSGLPANTPANRNAGQAAWYARNTLDAYPGGPAIRASCSDCHTQDGRDLKYFGFSNNSIIKRSEFHGLDNTTAKKIALYIRSLPGNAKARPWDPPYQPAPGLSDEPVEDWAAGGGLDAVLGSDAEMLPYLIPDTNNNGTRSQTEVDNALDVDGKLDVASMPIAVQLIDWNRWLPYAHPMDIWNDDFDFLTHSLSPQLEYESIREQLTTNGLDFYMINQARKDHLVNTLDGLAWTSEAWVHPAPWGDTDFCGGSPWRACGNFITNARAPGVSLENAKRALASWMGVKYFELMQDFTLEDKCDEIFGTTDGEKRCWPVQRQTVFPNAPHITAGTPNADENALIGGYLNNWVGQSVEVGDYLSTAWYQLQMTLNAGHRRQVDQFNPMDWFYQYIHLHDVAKQSGRYEPLRFVQSFLKAYQMRDNGGDAKDLGWALRTVHPWMMYADQDNGASLTGDPRMGMALDAYEPGLFAKVLGAFVNNFNTVAGSFTMSDWQRLSNGTRYQAAYFEIHPSTTATLGWTSGPEFHQWEHMDGFWRLLPHLTDIGVNAGYVADLKDWSALMWPGPNGAPNNWNARLGKSPIPHQVYDVKNVWKNTHLSGDTATGSIALAGGTGPSTEWRMVPTAGSFFRLVRTSPNGDATTYVLRASNATTLELASHDGDNLSQWQLENQGGGKHRVRNRHHNTSYLYVDGNGVVRLTTAPPATAAQWIFNR